MSVERCGLTLPDYALPPSTDGYCCCRPQWNEADGSGKTEHWDLSQRCIWHSRVDEKPETELESAWSDQTDPLDQAYLKGSTVPSVVSFAECSLSAADFSGSTYIDGNFVEAILVDANFSGATLDNGNFREADLTGATLSNAALEGADFTGANLSDANLSEADLTNADLTDADLENAELTDATARDANFSGANLMDAELNHTDLQRTTFDDAYATGAEFEGATLRGAQMPDAVLDNAVFTGANLLESYLPGARIRDSELSGADLSTADLTEVDLQWTDLSHARLNQTTLDRAILWRTKFTGASLVGASMTGTRSRSTHRSNEEQDTVSPFAVPPTGNQYWQTKVESPDNLDVRTMNPFQPSDNEKVNAADFADANLYGSDLSEVNLHAPNFNGANLQDATLVDATLREGALRQAVLERVNLTRTDLFDADLTGADIYSATFVETQINAETVFKEHYTDGDSLAKAAWTHRNLERLFRTNALPTPARRHYVRQKDVIRKRYYRRGEWSKYTRAIVSSVFTRYGESPLRVVFTSIGTILLCTLLYPVLGGIRMSPITGGTTLAFDSLPIPLDPVSGTARIWFESLYFSVLTFTNLGAGYRPASQAAQALSLVESFAGALLMALFVFVLGRRSTW